MILPITAYGSKVLKQEAEEIDKDYPGLGKFIADMYETMYRADGIGLAAPQVDRSIRLFVIDAGAMSDEYPELEGFKKIFINPNIVDRTGKEWFFNEGCLSVPGVREDVKRNERILIEYYDEDFGLKEESYDGVKARIIQHEYDHLDGILFVDRVSPIRKKLLRGRLSNITRGQVNVKYKMKFPAKK
jgi:peptide deformylase